MMEFVLSILIARYFEQKAYAFSEMSHSEFMAKLAFELGTFGFIVNPIYAKLPYHIQ